jgi:hypothetical protein
MKLCKVVFAHQHFLEVTVMSVGQIGQRLLFR